MVMVESPPTSSRIARTASGRPRRWQHHAACTRCTGRTRSWCPGSASTRCHQPQANAPAGTGPKTLSDVEMEYILQVYAKNNQNKQVTAAELGISLKTLYNKLHKYEEELRQRAG